MFGFTQVINITYEILKAFILTDCFLKGKNCL